MLRLCQQVASQILGCRCGAPKCHGAFCWKQQRSNEQTESCIFEPKGGLPGLQTQQLLDVQFPLYGLHDVRSGGSCRSRPLRKNLFLSLFFILTRRSWRISFAVMLNVCFLAEQELPTPRQQMHCAPSFPVSRFGNGSDMFESFATVWSRKMSSQRRRVHMHESYPIFQCGSERNQRRWAFHISSRVQRSPTVVDGGESTTSCGTSKHAATVTRRSEGARLLAAKQRDSTSDTKS